MAPTVFIGSVEQKISGEFHLEMNQHILECTSVHLPEDRGGQLIQAKTEHRELVSKMLLGFFQIFPDPTSAARHLDRMLGRIEKGDIYLWQNIEEECISMASVVRKIHRTASVSLVYTFDRHRGRGYGSRVTAHLTKKLLEEGWAACNLFTDASNPTSNAIYQKIGYQIIGSHSIFHIPSQE